MNEKNKLMLYILCDVILVVTLICSFNEFGLGTQRDQIFLGAMSLITITGIVNTIRLLIKIKGNS
jgi:hypothetical protein